MRATPILLAALFAAPTITAQPRPDDREALRAQLVVQARAARGREDFAACAAHYESAAAIRADVAAWYSAGLCAYLGGQLPEARRLAHACLGDASGDAMVRGQCALLLRELDDAERPAERPARAAPQPVSAPSVPPAQPAPARRQIVRSHAPPSAGPIALWSIGTALLGTAVVAAVLHADALAGCAVQGTQAVCATPADLDRARNAGTWETLGTGAFWGGVAAVAGGTTWWLLGRRAGAVSIAVMPTGIGLAGRF